MTTPEPRPDDSQGGELVPFPTGGHHRGNA